MSCSSACAFPEFSPRARFGFHKICRKTGEFAEAIGVVVDDPERAFLSRWWPARPAVAPSSWR